MPRTYPSIRARRAWRETLSWLYPGTAPSSPLARKRAVVSSVSAHHWEDREKGFAELARVLRPGGRMVLAELRPARGVRRALDRRPAHHDMPDAAEWLRLMAGTGFENARVVDVGWRRWLALFMRAERRAS